MTHTFELIRASKTLKKIVSPLVVCTTIFANIAPCLAGHSKPVAPVQAIPGISSVAYFATSNNAGENGGIAASMLDPILKVKLAQTGAFTITNFSPRLPSIDRALNVDNSLSSTDVQLPITDPTTALKIARVMGTDGCLLDEVDSYQEDATTHAISVTVSGNLYNTSTGTSLRTFAVTGTATPATPDQGSASVLKMAVQSAANQIVIALNVGQSKSAIVPMSNYRQSHGNPILLVLLAGALIGVIAHNDFHSSGVTPGTATPTAGSTSSSSTSSPPPPPL